MKRCEHCCELIHDNADRCRYCGARQEGYIRRLQEEQYAEYIKKKKEREDKEAAQAAWGCSAFLVFIEMGYLYWMPMSKLNSSIWIKLLLVGLASAITTCVINALLQFPRLKWVLAAVVFAAWVAIVHSWSFTDKIWVALLAGFIAVFFHLPFLIPKQ